MRYIPHSPADIEQMLAAVGVASVEELFRDIPAALRATAPADGPYFRLIRPWDARCRGWRPYTR